jgi:hypothetical protein
VPVAGPFYFAWVEPDETTFDVSHHRMDEHIFSAKRILAEGEKPLLEIEIQNPHVGILSPDRQYWAWFAWDNGTSIVPLFFGVVVGTPAEIFEEVIKLQFIADPIDYLQQVQQVAETLKVPPFYDPVFIDVASRDDPNSILEAHAKVWDVDPVTHEVTANDIIVGDSNENFTADDHFYDGMQMTIGQPPATAILMDASVSWTQTAQGLVDITQGYRTFTCLNGDGIISEWPKPATDIGGGYKVYFADAFDTAGAVDAEMVSWSWSWQNKSKKHTNGDPLSTNVTYSSPMGGQVWAQKVLTWQQQTGVLDPFATDDEGDSAPLNIPPKYNDTTGYVMGWKVAAAMTVKYEAARPRTERVIFQVRADTQFTGAQPSQQIEMLTRSGADVGVPIISPLNWTTIAGTAVAVGQLIFPDNLNIPGARTAQICVTAGTAGTTAPEFSDLPGVTTIDGSVTWSSLGEATPSDNAVDWTYGSHVNAGTVILPKRPFVVQLSTLILPGVHAFPQAGVAIAEGTYVQNADGSYAVCTLAGTVGPTETTAVLTPLDSLPTGRSYFIATTAGITGAQYLIPPFDETLHATTTDGTVVWTCIGSGDIPAGGYPGEVHTATYFATDRGRQSLEYLAALVRAKLLYRARCVDISFDCDYARGTAITTRKTATLHDPRIAGGVALGKVKGAELSVSDTGVAGCRVTIACCAGNGNAVDEVPGDPSYVDAGYVEDGYQWHDNSTIVLPTTTDLGYAPPAYVATDDGLTFPLARSDIVLVDAFHQGADVANAALENMATAAQAAMAPPPSNDQAGIYQQQREQKMLSANTLAKLLAANPSWQEFQLKPVAGGQFNKVYNVKFTDLTVPMGIDLQAS